MSVLCSFVYVLFFDSGYDIESVRFDDKFPFPLAAGGLGIDNGAAIVCRFEADRARREALRELRAWFRDWSTTLRTEFDAPEQIVLGLKRVARRGGATSEEEAGP